MEKAGISGTTFAKGIATDRKAHGPGYCVVVDYIAAKQLIAPALNALLGESKESVRGFLCADVGAIRALVKRAVKSGDIRKDLDAIRSLRALIGRRQRGHQSGLAAERQKTRRHPHRRFTPGEIGQRHFGLRTLL